MLDELSPFLNSEKTADLVGRLNKSKLINQVLPAEMELALIWAVSKLGDLDIEPYWWGDDKRPDLYTENLFLSKPCVIEIAAINDNELSGEEAMDRIAQTIVKFANEVKKNEGDYLYFSFGETSGYLNTGYKRWRLAPDSYELDETQKMSLSTWINGSFSERGSLTLSGRGLAVVVERLEHKQIRYHNIHSSMPPEAYSLEDNPIFKLLDSKRRQLRAAPRGSLRIVFLADVGSTLLNKLGRYGEHDHTNRRISATQIIKHFLRKRITAVDAVAVFSPKKDYRLFNGKGRFWETFVFEAATTPKLKESIEALVKILPPPQFEGYQARSLFRQDAFSTKRRGWYLGMTITSNKNDGLCVKFPSRLLLDLLAGRISEEHFRKNTSIGDSASNMFQNFLDKGMTFSRVEMAPRELDHDDDYLIMYFAEDPAASRFK